MDQCQLEVQIQKMKIQFVIYYFKQIWLFNMVKIYNLMKKCSKKWNKIQIQMKIMNDIMYIDQSKLTKKAQQQQISKIIVINIYNNINMVKTVYKKKKKKSMMIQKKVHEIQKLSRGYKYCKGCQMILHIHKYTCQNCGYVQNIKKNQSIKIVSLDQITTKTVKNILENNYYNQTYQYFCGIIFSPTKLIELENLSQLCYTSQSLKNQKQNDFFHATQHSKFKIHSIGRPVSNIVGITNGIVFIEVITRQHIDMTQQMKITMRGYGLQKYHRIGSKHEGKCLLKYVSDNKIILEILLQQDVVMIKSLSNKLAIITGSHMIILLTLDINNVKTKQFASYKTPKLPQLQLPNDQPMTLQWLQQDSYSKLLVGSLMGHIYIYNIEIDDKINLFRIIYNSHSEWVTVIKACCLGDGSCLFASGSYDGQVCIWNVHQKNAVIRQQVSNCKISSLVWDEGAKFLLVIREENLDNCILLCFYAIEKIDKIIHLQTNIDIRILDRTPSCCIVKHDFGSEIIITIDTSSGIMKFFCLEEIRKLSFKRKKQRKDKKILMMYQIIKQGHELKFINLKENTVSQVQNEKFCFPFISDFWHEYRDGINWIYGCTYEGIIFQGQFHMGQHKFIAVNMQEQKQQSLLNNYEVIRVLGQGSFGKVFLIRQVISNHEYAMKKYSKYHLIKNGKDRNLLRSVRILKKLNHPNIIKLIKYILSTDDALYLIFQPCKKGSLDNIKYHLIKIGSFKIIVYVLYQLVEALLYLKSVSVAHRDIKPSNISFNSLGELKIIDFDEAVCFNEKNFEEEDNTFKLGIDTSLQPKIFSSRRSRANSYVGTQSYMSPQMKRCLSTDQRGDIWALGCIFYQMMTGQSLQIQFDDQINITKQINERMENLHKNKVNSQFIDLLSKILVFDPIKRISIEQIIKHDCFTLLRNNYNIREQCRIELIKFLRGNYNLINISSLFDALKIDLIGMKPGNQLFQNLKTVIMLYNGQRLKINFIISGPKYFKIKDTLNSNNKIYICYNQIENICIKQQFIHINCNKNIIQNNLYPTQTKIIIKHIYPEMLGNLYDILLYILHD